MGNGRRRERPGFGAGRVGGSGTLDRAFRGLEPFPGLFLFFLYFRNARPRDVIGLDSTTILSGRYRTRSSIRNHLFLKSLSNLEDLEDLFLIPSIVIPPLPPLRREVGDALK